MAVIRNLVVKIAADISSLSNGLKTAQKTLKNAASNITKIGSKLTASLTVPIAALGNKIVSLSKDFEQSMANAGSVSNATAEELARMKDIAREMGAKTVFSASDAADALYYMASAGYKVDQMASAIEPTLNLASATQNDLAFTTDTVVAALNQFGLKAESADRVANVFAAAIGYSQATLDNLGTSMSYVGPVAHSLGYSIEETSGALSVLYNAGYDGSMAGTSLRQALVSLMNPTSSAKKIFEELNIDLKNLDPTTNSFADILDTLSKSGITTAQAMEVFGARAGPGMLALFSAGGDAVREMTDAITGTNSANEMAAMQLDTLQGEYAELESQVEEIALQFGDILIPIIRELIQKYITPLLIKIMSLSDGTRKQIVTIALLAAAIGPLLLVLGKLMSSMSLITKVGSLLFSKIGLIIAILTAVVLVVKHLWDTNEEFRTAVLDIWDKIKGYILNAVTKIKKWWDKNGEKVIAQAISAFKNIWTVIKSVFGKVVKIAAKVWPYVKEIVLDTINGIMNFWEKNGAKIWTTVSTLFKLIWEIALTAFDIISNGIIKFITYIRPIWENIKSLFSSLWDTLVSLYETLKPVFELIGGLVLVLLGIVMGVINGIISSLGPLIQAVIDIAKVVLEKIQLVCALLRGDWSEAWEHMKNIASGVWSAIKNIFLAIWEFIKGFCEGVGKFFSNLGGSISDVFESAWTGIKGFFTNIWEGIKSACSWVWDGITGLFSSIGDFFKGLCSDAFNWGKGLIENIWNGIKKAWDWVVDGVTNIGQTIKDFLGFGSPTKKGPGRTADEWIPNLLGMMEKDFYNGMPNIQRAAMSIAGSMNITSSPRAMVNAGYSPSSDVVNGLLQGMYALRETDQQEKGVINLNIDGQTFARLIMPKLNREYKRQGIVLKDV
ncbi:MAG TPA: phage tail tape measure protein [Clostridia bacterium]